MSASVDLHQHSAHSRFAAESEFVLHFIARHAACLACAAVRVRILVRASDTHTVAVEHGKNDIKHRSVRETKIPRAANGGGCVSGYSERANDAVSSALAQIFERLRMSAQRVRALLLVQHKNIYTISAEPGECFIDRLAGKLAVVGICLGADYRTDRAALLAIESYSLFYILVVVVVLRRVYKVYSAVKRMCDHRRTLTQRQVGSEP